MIIYRITNLINGKIYIGQTVKSMSKRWSEHVYYVGIKTTALYAALYKYGIDNFSVEIICSAIKPEYLNELERYFIKHYNCMSPNGYNLTSGGDSAFKRSDESKRKMSETMRGHPVSVKTRKIFSSLLKGKPGIRKGFKASKETRLKLSQCQIGKKASLATRKKMSKSHKRRFKETAARIRTPKQLEWLKTLHERNKISAIHCKPIMAIETGIVYASIKDASEKLNIHRGLLWDLIKNKRTHRRTHLTFRYIDILDSVR
jgi:group I intron endonuclease